MKVKIFYYFIFFYLYLFSNSFAEDFNLKFHKLNINSYTEKHPLQIGKIRGNIGGEPYPYGFNYYGVFENGKISEIIETFFLDNHGDFLRRFNAYARSVVYTSNLKNGCNNSEEKLYHAIVDNGRLHFSCFSVKEITNMEELWEPNFNKAAVFGYSIPMNQRKNVLKKALDQQIKLPNKMFRVEHYFYKSGKLIWVFYSVDVNLFFNQINQKNIEKFIDIAIQNHKNFEKDLRYKDYLLIDFE